MRPAVPPVRPRPLLVPLLMLWLLGALLVGATGLLARFPGPPPAVALLLAAALLLLLGGSLRLRERVRALGLRPLVAFHLLRVPAGAYFLFLWGRGALPGDFALVAGWGDVLVGAGAALAAWRCFPPSGGVRRRGLLLWNALGLLDISLVLANGLRAFSRDPALMEAFTALPLALLPAFVVPLVLVSHALIFAWALPGRAERERRASPR